MNDRFKFRVWYSPKEREPEMIYDAEQTYDNRCQNKGSFYHISFGDIISDDECVIMQSTGVKDKDGDLIYEGDIVDEVGFTYHKIVWADEYSCYMMIALNGNNLLDGRLDKTTEEGCHRIKIIGNIYENRDIILNNKKASV